MQGKNYYVEIWQTGIPEDFLLARVVLRGDGSIDIESKEEGFKALLLQGVAGNYGEIKRPLDGLAYLYAITEAYHGTSLMATSVQEGEPPTE